MNEILESIGFNVNAVIFSTINFFVVLIILQKFLFGKVGKNLEERKKRIALSLENAEKIEEKLDEIARQKAEIIKKANQEANDIVINAKKTADEMTLKMKEEAIKAIEKNRDESLLKLEKEREKMIDNLKKETAELAINATQKIISQKIDKEQDKKIIQDYLSKIN